MKFEYPKYKLRIRMIFINMALAVIPLIIFGVITYGVFINNTNRIMTDTVDLMFEQMSGRLDEYFESINTVSKIFYFDTAVQKILYNDPDISNYDSLIGINTQLNKSFMMNSTIEDSYIITKTNKIVGTGSPYFEYDVNELVDKMRESKKNIEFMAVPGEKGKNLIVAVKPLKYVMTLEDLGTGLIFLNKNKVSAMIEKSIYGSKLEVMILDSKGNPIIKPKSNINIPISEITKDQNTFKIGRDKYRYITHTSPATGWELVAVISEKSLYHDSRMLTYYIIFYVLLIMVLAVAVTIITNLQVTKPIVKLSQAIDKFALGDFKQKIYFKEKNEITAIADNFNYMVDEIKSLTLKIFNTQQQLYESELDKKLFHVSLLQSQINSHFLYNTLSCIRGMAKKGASDDVDEIITHLVKMLRYASVLEEKVMLKNELGNVADYISIQRKRFGNQLSLEFDTIDDVLECHIPKMLLQPVVENSILHGFCAGKDRWMIKIRSKLENNLLSITIMDNGCGINKQQLNDINLSLQSKSKLIGTNDKKTSIGLINISNRLNTLYKDEYEVNVKSWVGLGTAVEIKIPYKRCD